MSGRESSAAAPEVASGAVVPPRASEPGLERGFWKLPALSGVLLGLSYLPGPFLPLNLAAFLPLMLWIDRHPRARAGARLRAGLVFGLVAHAIAMHWQYSMLEQSWLAALLYAGMVALFGARLAVQVALAGWLRHRTGVGWGLLLPIAWIPFEWAQTWGDLRMTGEHLAHTVAGYPFLVQIADLAGPYGATASLLAINGLLHEATVGGGRRKRAAAVLVALVAAIVGYDTWRWNADVPSAGTVRVGFIQPDVPLSMKHAAGTEDEQWSRLVELTEQAKAAGAELVVWPETARPDPIYHWPDRPETFAMPEVQALARRLDVSLIVGVEYVIVRDRDDYDLYNAAMAVDPEGRLLRTWGAKVYLVPFVEATPFRAVLGPLVEGRGGEWRWLAGGFLPGPRSAILEVAGARIGALVCYEQLFFELARRARLAGAEIQVVLTNDAWFGRSLFQPYQANALRLRAIENRTWFVRAANTGISGFVDPWGRYHERTGLFERGVAVADIARTTGLTVYDRVGDVVAWIAVALLGAAIVLARRAGRP